MRRFWLPAEAAQADYESLREASLAGVPLLGMAAGRFERRGLAGLITWPAAEPVFEAIVVGARRPPWTPHVDPRLETLAVGYALLLDVEGTAAAAADAQEVSS